MNNSLLFKKIYGCLLGGLIGDAMGAPVEAKDYWEIEKEYGEISDFEGGGTDDSLIKLFLCEAIIENDGNITADEFAASFLKNKEIYNKNIKLIYPPVRNMFHKVESKLSLPVYAGMGNMHSSSSAMAISPMGLINACNPRSAALETYDVAGLIHGGDSTFCRDAACAMAAAVAEAMKPNSTVESILEASTIYLHKTSSVEMRTCIEKTLKMAQEEGDYKKFRKRFYETSLRDITPDSRETVPTTIALFYLAEGDVAQSIIYGANFGRDADTIATMVGALAGAFKGVDGFKPEWVDKTVANNPGQVELAEKLMDVVKRKAGEVKDNISLFEQLYH